MTTNAPAALMHAVPLGRGPWPVMDPFLFCVHHDDAYPRGDTRLGPVDSLAGRQVGSDFSARDGWSMYHGEHVPGFPAHPHRGFETVTIVRRGLVDHADSLGAAARYGRGDVQWLTAGDGIVHAEMFPLLDASAPNPLELFQIWLNLPAASKRAPPHFSMLWASDVPRHVVRDAEGAGATVTHVAGRLSASTVGHDGPLPPPPPHSWASRPEADVAIATVALAPGARWTLDAAAGGAGTGRVLYVFAGEAVGIDGRRLPVPVALQLDATVPATLQALGDRTVEALLLQGRPIGEPVAQQGPFVMNTQDELRQAFEDYRRTGFGGWPWDRPDPVHGTAPRRFARRPGGQEESPERK